MKNRLVLSALFAVIVAACASGSGARLYQKEVGLASGTDLRRITSLMYLRFHYEVAEHDSVPMLRWESHWRPRSPFRDEQELGVTNAESRLIVIGRARSESDVMTTYTARVTMENRVRVAGSEVWNESLNTPMFRAYADSLAEGFRTEIANIGVRRY